MEWDGAAVGAHLRSMSERVTTLLSHGLNDSEAKTYLALLEEPRMTATALASVTGVPRSHIYKVLEGLHARGLVDIVLEGGTRVYRARPFGEFLEQRAHELRQHLSHLEAQAKLLGEVLRPPPSAQRSEPDAGEVRLVFGRKAVAREISDLLDSAAEEVVISAREGSVERAARHLSALGGTRTQRTTEPRVTLVVPEGSAGRDVPGLGESVLLRRIDGGPRFLTFIADEAKLLMVHPIPEGGDMRSGRDVALFSDDPVFVGGMKVLLFSASRPEGNGGA